LKCKTQLYSTIGAGVRDSQITNKAVDAYNKVLALTLPYTETKDTIGNKPITKESLQEWKKILEARKAAYEKSKTKDKA
jgi:hypothetical protein